MGKINILDSSIFNRIAAGEVVERPCSVIKELVENAIDAGANNISIEIKNGGIDMIRVIDDGCGIEPDDLEKAFLPHSTSKIKELKDLNEIKTLGFRGEALTSIASVAKVTLCSKTEDDEVGSFIVIENGVILEKGERGRSRGTTVTVEGLFKNIPARAKFLAKPSTEESVITDMVSRLIMTNYNKSIIYTANGKTIYQSSGDDLKKAIYSVYGKSFIDNMEQIRGVMSGITLDGYINKPYFTKPNRTYQTLIVNGRYVVNSEISFVVFNCYRDYLMKRQFPAFVLCIDVPQDMIDVNVHPNKLEVKFANFDAIKRAVYTTIKTKLEELIGVPKELRTEKSEDRTQPTIKKYDTDGMEKEFAATENKLGTFFSLEPKPKNPFQSATVKSSFATTGSAVKDFMESLQAKSSINVAQNLIPKNNPIDENSIQMVFDSENKIVDENIFKPQPKLKTVLFDTYIVLEESDSVLLIDQHAAHERILYDKLVKEYESRRVVSQDMLLPYIFDLTPTDSKLLTERIDDINSCGFSLTPLSGDSFSLSAIPLTCIGMKNDYFIGMILEGLQNNKFKKIDFIKDVLMHAACKAAIKGEEQLDESEIAFLIKQFEIGNKTLLCPHGRPLIVRISKSEIEKWFKRVI